MIKAIEELDNCVTSDVIKTQFIERDLYNATDISQIKWKIYSENFTKTNFETYLKKNKEALEDLLKNEESKAKIQKWFNMKENQKNITILPEKLGNDIKPIYAERLRL